MRTEPIGIVTVTYNSGLVISDFLRCVFAQDYTNFLLFAIDNASSDNTIELMSTWVDGRFTIIANASNVGIAEGDNQGIIKALEAGCSSILLLNNDTEFDCTLFGRLVRGLEQYACDMICPKMLIFDQPDKIWAAGGCFKPRLGYRTVHYGEGELDCGQYDTPQVVTFAPACCILVRADLFDRIGLMDPRYFVYSDDADFLYRALQVDAKLYYLPSAVLLHKVSSLTGGDESPFSIRFSTRNRAYFKWKHFPWARAFFWNMVVRAYYLLQLLTFRTTFAVFVMRQRAISEAYTMPRKASDIRLQALADTSYSRRADQGGASSP